MIMCEWKNLLIPQKETQDNLRTCCVIGSCSCKYTLATAQPNFQPSRVPVYLGLYYMCGHIHTNNFHAIEYSILTRPDCPQLKWYTYLHIIFISMCSPCSISREYFDVQIPADLEDFLWDLTCHFLSFGGFYIKGCFSLYKTSQLFIYLYNYGKIQDSTSQLYAESPEI
jgi:hypothetical protein